LLRADDRAWALPTPGGDRVFVVHYHSGASGALAVSLTALLASILLAGRGRGTNLGGETRVGA
jgi:hypothetical protein